MEYICKFCGKTFNNQHVYSGHVSKCKRKYISKDKLELKTFYIKCKKCNKEFSITCSEYDFENDNYKHFCSKSCANGHIHSEETKEKISKSIKKFIRLNDKKKDNIILTSRICKICGKEFYPSVFTHKNGRKRISNATTCSDECYRKLISIKNIDAGSGGFKEGSVKNYKSGWYKGIHCDSSWELAFIIWNIDNGHEIKRYKETRYYILNGQQKKYFPDFLVDNKYIFEIKGINDNISKLKQIYNPDVIFLYKNDMEFYLNYVVEKYGENFISLYDKKDK